MDFYIILFIILFSIVSTSILTYISISIMIGPWIHSFIIVMVSLIFKIFYKDLDEKSRLYNISIITLGSSIGGILATAIGFAFPTLYFLDSNLFNSWLSKPFYFMSVIFFISLTGSLIAYSSVLFFQNEMLFLRRLPFAIGTISYDLIISVSNLKRAYYLFHGLIVNIFYSVLLFISKTDSLKISDQIYLYKNIILNPFSIPLLEGPLLISIGFIAGSILTGSLIIGILTNIFLISPLYNLYFQYIKYNDFIISFIGGIVIYSAFLSILNIPTVFKNFISKFHFDNNDIYISSFFEKKYIINFLLFIFVSAFLTYFKFSLIFQLYLILFTIICIYQILLIAGKLSIAPLARFATFIMIPALFIFNIDYVQATILSSFVEVACGVAVDLMFGLKLASLANLKKEDVKKAQLIGIFISSIVVAIISYLLINKLKLGVHGMIAQRSYTRALTIKFKNFDFYSSLLGALFGALLNDLKFNSIMVLGSLLMPLNWSVMLLIGCILSYILNSRNKNDYDLFFSGIFASSSLIIILYRLF
jgi:hypothetical protein